MARISRLNEKLSAGSVGLVMFDTLNGYLHPKDPQRIAFLEENKVLEKLQALKQGVEAVGMTTFFPYAQHAADGSDAVDRLTDTDMELRSDDGKPSVIKQKIFKGTWESQVADEVAPLEQDVMIPKNRWNAFHQTNLELQLRVRGIDTIILAGGSTDVGIASTMFAARDLDYGIVVVSDACYSARGNNSQFFMERVFPRMGRVLTVEETVALLQP